METPPTKEERKISRAARRQKQHENNFLRAAKMHELRVQAEKNPPAQNPPAQNPWVKASSSPRKSSSLTQYHIGCSGWFYWHWRDTFYPADMPTKEWFAHYMKGFRTVEINASFYSWPTAATVQSWRKQAGRKKFIYTVKVNELITHSKKFTGTKMMVRDFSYIADLLGDRMGCFLYQTPPSFHYTPARLRAIVGQLDSGYKNVVEFRHASWWNKKVYAAFKEAGIIFCSISAPRLPDELIKTSDDIYIRFHGKDAWYRHNYSHEELQDWAQRIKQAKPRHVWIYFNNDFNGYAISNAKKLTRLLKA